MDMQREKNKVNETLTVDGTNPGRLLKTQKVERKRNYNFFL